MTKSQQSWVRSQLLLTQWNLKRGREAVLNIVHKIKNSQKIPLFLRIFPTLGRKILQRVGNTVSRLGSREFFNVRWMQGSFSTPSFCRLQIMLDEVVFISYPQLFIWIPASCNLEKYQLWTRTGPVRIILEYLSPSSSSQSGVFHHEFHGEFYTASSSDLRWYRILLWT